jgi:hypothetical protein
MTGSTESATQQASSPPATAAQPPQTTEDGLMSKLWKAAGSWFGADAQEQPPSDTAPDPVPAPVESASPGERPPMSIPVYDIPPLAAAPTNDETQSPRVVVIQGPRAIPKIAAPAAPPSQQPSPSPPVSPRGPKLTGAPSPYGTQVAKMFPRAASPSVSPERSATILRQPSPMPNPPAAANAGGTMQRPSPSPSFSDVANSGTMMRQYSPSAAAPVLPVTYDEPRASTAGGTDAKQRCVFVPPFINVLASCAE